MISENYLFACWWKHFALQFVNICVWYSFHWLLHLLFSFIGKVLSMWITINLFEKSIVSFYTQRWHVGWVRYKLCRNVKPFVLRWHVHQNLNFHYNSFQYKFIKKSVLIYVVFYLCKDGGWKIVVKFMVKSRIKHIFKKFFSSQGSNYGNYIHIVCSMFCTLFYTSEKISCCWFHLLLLMQMTSAKI